MGFWDWMASGNGVSGVCLIVVTGFVIIAVVAMIKGYELPLK